MPPLAEALLPSYHRTPLETRVRRREWRYQASDTRLHVPAQEREVRCCREINEVAVNYTAYSTRFRQEENTRRDRGRDALRRDSEARH